MLFLLLQILHLLAVAAVAAVASAGSTARSGAAVSAAVEPSSAAVVGDTGVEDTDSRLTAAASSYDAASDIGRSGYGSEFGGYSSGGLGGYSGGYTATAGGYGGGLGGYGGYGGHAQNVGYLVSHHDGYGDDKGGKSKGSYYGGGGKDKGYYGKSKGKDYYDDYDYHYDDSLLVKQPVLVHKPVVVHKPAVAYKTVVVKSPKPKYESPILVHKPVIYKTKEWRLVDVPKVHYTPAYITPVHDNYDYYDEKGGKDKGKGSYGGKKGSGGGSWWDGLW